MSKGGGVLNPGKLKSKGGGVLNPGKLLSLKEVEFSI